ncbi:tetratricopeptide repeat protein [Azospirillum sp.]|uniref:O-linked N-acetylglucosamine transferase, SPINDLY family protein n=1 Tax=Azospirillum sp. TaxID=34012 RepID=UPI002D2F19CE|nr:tetratricopeptide repeat protein [Azospirillum sp.]HYD66563.1 tetratricopeptide repeat protein [Azospirillum sp.]
MSRKDRRVGAKLPKPSSRIGAAPAATATPTPAAPAEALFAEAVRLHGAGRAAEAEALYRRLLAVAPDHVNALNNLGIALRQLGRLEEAIAVYRRVIGLKPDFADPHYNTGVALQKLGRMEAAAQAYARAAELRPGYAQALSNLGIVLAALGRIERAVEFYREAIRAKPDHWEAYINMGGALDRLGRLAEAEAALRQALALNPRSPELLGNLGNVLKSRGQLAEAEAACRQALEFDPDCRPVHCNLLFALNYRADLTPQAVFAAHRAWAERHEKPVLARHPQPVHPPPRDPERRLKIGFVSPDLRAHSVAHFLEPLLAALDPRAVEVFCYAEVTEPDAVTARLQELSRGWRSTLGLSDAAVADRVRADGIDILVDLAGHTANNRLPAFAHRPAPVQVTWLGYPNTTGMTTIGYRITDAIADPVSVADALHTEMLVRLPHGFLCYAAPDNAGPVATSPMAANGFVTFGSFNNLSKVTPEVVRVWSRVLRRVPDSRLIVKSTPLADEATRQRYRELFAGHGIDPARVDLMGRISTQGGHLAAYGRIDVALDTFPYNGTTTTCEALWMGVPVVTWAGDRHAARVSASILARIGLPGLAACDEDGYVDLAAALAANPAKLAELRGTLRERMRASPLCDAPRFARIMEAAFRGLWRRWCAGQA